MNSKEETNFSSIEESSSTHNNNNSKVKEESIAEMEGKAQQEDVGKSNDGGGFQNSDGSQSANFDVDAQSAHQNMANMFGLSSNNMMNNVNANVFNAALSAAVNKQAAGASNGNNSTSSSYRDFSRVPLENQTSENAFVSTTSSGKDPPFPVKLHRILSNPEFRDYIMWLPHGRSWRVLKPKAFEEKVIPLYFRHAKYASFMRQVNGWGFKRMTQGPDHNSYYHELFLRGLPHICMKMRRPAKAKSAGNDVETNPDFYRMSMVAPLPTTDESGAQAPTLGGMVPTQELLAGLAANSNASAVANVGGQVAPVGFSGLQNALVLPNHAGIAAATPGFNMGMVNASNQGSFDPASFSSASELLQQHIKNQLQQGWAAGNKPFHHQQAAAMAAVTAPNPQLQQQPQNNQLNGGGSNNDSTSLGGDNKNSNEASDNLEVIKQRMKERSELVRQLKEVMDGNAPGAPGSAPAGDGNISIPTQVVQQTSDATNAPAPNATAANAAAANVFAGSPHAQFQQMIPAAAVGNPQMQQMMNQFNPAASGLIPGMGTIGGALAGLGQFPNAAMMGGGMGMLGTGQLLAAQPNFMGGGVVGAAGAPGVMNNHLASTTAPGFQNLSIMAMQNPAVLAQLQAANQMGNFQGGMNFSFNQQVPDLGSKQGNPAGAAASGIQS